MFLILPSFAETEISQKQQDEITIFLENLMIRDEGLYTLLGSKPMTEFDITDTLDKTEQEIAQSYEELKISLKEQALKSEKSSVKYYGIHGQRLMEPSRHLLTK